MGWVTGRGLTSWSMFQNPSLNLWYTIWAAERRNELDLRLRLPNASELVPKNCKTHRERLNSVISWILWKRRKIRELLGIVSQIKITRDLHSRSINNFLAHVETYWEPFLSPELFKIAWCRQLVYHKRARWDQKRSTEQHDVSRKASKLIPNILLLLPEWFRVITTHRGCQNMECTDFGWRVERWSCPP